MYHLEVLDLSNNSIASPVPVLNMPCLEELLLDNNPITELAFIAESQLVPMIRTISIRGCDALYQKYGRKDTIDIDSEEREHYCNKLFPDYDSRKDNYTRIA